MTLQSSPMGRGGHRDDRRRRLLAEDLTASAGLSGDNSSIAADRTAPRAHKSQHYGDSEFLESQPRLTDLIPRRLITYFLLLLIGFATIAGLFALYAWGPELFRSPVRPAMADIGKPGSLGNWIAQLLLIAAGLMAVITYTVRRHKMDDYHGRYYVWLWAAGCWLIMAADIAAGLHSCLQQVMISVTDTRIIGNGSIWWLIPALLLVGAIGSRLLIDMWASRLSSIAFLLAAAAYLAALAASFRWIALQSDLHQLLLIEGSKLAGPLLLAIAMALHARYVILDAEGALPLRAVKKKAVRRRVAKKGEKSAGDAATKNGANSGKSDTHDAEGEGDEAADEVPDDAWVAVDPPHAGAQPILKRVTPGETAAPSTSQKITIPAAGTSSSSAADEGKLSRVDRKALKKKLLDERLQRERKASNW